MELTPEQRVQIYIEERERRCAGANVAARAPLAAITLFAFAALAGLYAVALSRPRRRLRINDLREAYDGLSPDEYQA